MTTLNGSGLDGKKVLIDPTGLSVVTATDVQGAIAELDAAPGPTQQLAAQFFVDLEATEDTDLRVFETLFAAVDWAWGETNQTLEFVLAGGQFRWDGTGTALDDDTEDYTFSGMGRENTQILLDIGSTIDGGGVNLTFRNMTVKMFGGGVGAINLHDFQYRFENCLIEGLEISADDARFEFSNCILDRCTFVVVASTSCAIRAYDTYFKTDAAGNDVVFDWGAAYFGAFNFPSRFVNCTFDCVWGGAPGTLFRSTSNSGNGELHLRDCSFILFNGGNACTIFNVHPAQDVEMRDARFTLDDKSSYDFGATTNFVNPVAAVCYTDGVFVLNPPTGLHFSQGFTDTGVSPTIDTTPLAADSAKTLDILVSAEDPTTNDSAAWFIRALAEDQGGVRAIVGSTGTGTPTFATAGAAAWTTALSMSGVLVRITGGSANATTKWTVKVTQARAV